MASLIWFAKKDLLVTLYHLCKQKTNFNVAGLQQQKTTKCFTPVNQQEESMTIMARTYQSKT